MSFDDFNVLEEFAEASGERREFFDGESYSFRRLGKLDNSDLGKLAHRLACARWEKANPKYHLLKYARNPEGQAARKARYLAKLRKMRPEKLAELWRKAYATAKAKPGYVEKARARALAWQRAAMADPVKAEAIRKRKREWARKHSRARA